MRHRCHCRCHRTADAEPSCTGPIPSDTHGGADPDAVDDEGVAIDAPVAIVTACTECSRAHLEALLNPPPKPKPPITPWVDEDGG